MQHYFAKNKNLDLEDTDLFHIKKVMRMNKGDLIKIVYDNVKYTCKIIDINSFKYEIIKKEEKNQKRVKIISAFSMLKEQKMDYLLQKSTEIGIDEFFPVITKRSIIKYNDNKETVKIIRWQKILKEASEQSFRFDVPKINKVTNLKEIIKIKADLKLLFTLNEKTKNIKKVLEKNNNCDRILIVTGPEGGFDLEEEKYLLDNGFIAVTIGENVLRSETAPIVIASMINYEFMR